MLHIPKVERKQRSDKGIGLRQCIFRRTAYWDSAERSDLAETLRICNAGERIFVTSSSIQLFSKENWTSEKVKSTLACLCSGKHKWTLWIRVLSGSMYDERVETYKGLGALFVVI